MPVYFVGIISTIVDIELYGSLNLNQDETPVDPSTINFNKSNASPPKSNMPLKSNQNSPSSVQQTLVEKRLNYMSNYLRNIFFTLSLNQSNLDGLIAIYELMK